MESDQVVTKNANGHFVYKVPQNVIADNVLMHDFVEEAISNDLSQRGTVAIVPITEKVALGSLRHQMYVKYGYQTRISSTEMLSIAALVANGVFDKDACIIGADASFADRNQAFCTLYVERINEHFWLDVARLTESFMCEPGMMIAFTVK